MSGKDGGWILPTEIDPERVCVKLFIPNDPAHLAAFWGALWNLTYWNQWQRDPLKQGTQVAAVWKEVWFDARAINDGLEGCEIVPFDVRQNEETPCILEKTEDGETWVEFANLQLCPPLIRQLPNGTVEYSTDDGETWTPVPVDTTYDPIYEDPPPPRPRPEEAPNGKRCSAAQSAMLAYVDLAQRTEVLLAANQFPFGVAGSMAGMLTNQLNFFMSGSFFDNLSANATFQLNAVSYFSTILLNAVAAEKSSAEYFHDTTEYWDSDVQEAFRCALYCAMDDEGVVSYADAIDALNEAEDVPDEFVSFVELIGAGGLNAAISAYAASVEDSECDDCDCEETWCYRWDLTDTDGGWTPVVFGSADAAWSSGDGWGIGTNNSQEIIITRDFDSVAIDGFRVDFDASILEGTNPYVLWKLNGTTLESSPVLAPQNYFEVTYDAQIVTNLWVGYNSAWTYSAGTDTTTRKIVAFQMWGRGENPFGEDNCEVT